MNIVILIKQVPGTKAHIETKEDGTLAREKASSIINSFDKNVPEVALTIRRSVMRKLLRNWYQKRTLFVKPVGGELLKRRTYAIPSNSEI
nr:hypothetical protein [Candidatus Njordarchaeota archaeon]